MNSSGIKRGLAYSAITALAVTGVPFLATSASANPASSQVTAVTLLSQSTGQASLKNDGTDATIRLEAAAQAAVTSVTFQYRIADAAPWQDIATVARNDDGAFSTEWAAAAVIGGTVDIRVVGTVSPGVTEEDQADDVVINGAGAGVESVNLPTDSALGVFQTPYGSGDQNVVVSGTTSSVDTADDVTVEVLTGTAAGNNVVADVEVAQNATTGTFTDVLDINGYTYGASDELVLGAELESDDVEAYTLYKQTITTVTAVAEDTTVPIGDTTPVVVTVLDQAGAPIAGARVTDSDGNPVGTGFTDSNGQVSGTQDAGTEYYYADATAAVGYNAAAGDKRSSDVTVTEFAPTPTSLVATSDDGAAFDFDENDGDDITVQVKDQNNGNFDSDDAQDLAYYWVITPFDGTPATVREPATGTLPVTTDANGEFIVPLPSGESGTYELYAALTADGLGNNAIASSKVLTVKAGEAEITFDEESEAAPAGSEEVVDGQLVLEDGTGLVGRLIDLTYTQGADGTDPVADAGFAPVAPAPAAPNDLARQVTTVAGGAFSITVDDEVETPQGTELGGFVSATTAATPLIGDADASASQNVDFTSDVPPAGTTVVIAPMGGNRPGEATSGSATVTAPDDTNDTDPNTPGIQGDADTDRDIVAGQTVTLTIDKGFFTTGAEETPSVVDADAGNLVSLGQEITRTTNASGIVTFQTAIERDPGFDDDGMVDATVTATAGTAADTEAVEYDSSDPLNGGTVEIVLSPEGEQNGPVDPAPAGNIVYYDVFTTDQFGNLVGDEDVDLTYAGDLDNWNYSNGSVDSDFDDNGDFWVTSYEAGDIDVTGEWETETFTYSNLVGGTQAGPDETLTDTVTASFYEAVVTTTTIESSPEGEVPVGSAVTETVTVLDQEGNPIQGLAVEFIRNGPGAGDGDANVERTTNAQGKAFYTFIGTQEGVANITATVTSDDGIETLNDSVVFVGTGPGPIEEIEAVLGGRTLGQFDRLRVKAPASAAGAVVRLYKVVNGRRIQVGNTRGLNAKGNVIFSVVDRNGRKFTKYVAVVRKTDRTMGDTTNPKSLR